MPWYVTYEESKREVSIQAKYVFNVKEDYSYDQIMLPVKIKLVTAIPPQIGPNINSKIRIFW